MSAAKPRQTRARVAKQIDGARVTEAQVTEQCVAYAAAHGVKLDRRNVGVAVYGKSRVRYGKAGDPDWEGTLGGAKGAGRRLCVEFKAPGERPRPEQLARLQELIRGGAQAFWTSSLEHFRKVLDALLLGAGIEAEGSEDRGPVLVFPESRDSKEV